MTNRPRQYAANPSPGASNTGEGDDYPFLFFGHGELSSDAIDKCEEVALWFARAPTLAERARIVATCPPPLASFNWGDCFAYFGSPGDVYDGLIAEAYGPPEFQEELKAAQGRWADGDFEGDSPDWGDAIEGALPSYAADLDRWVAEVHAIVPIVFFLGPNGADEDDGWNRWSEAQVTRALDAVLAWQAEHPWAAQGENAGEVPVEPAPSSGSEEGTPEVEDYLVASLPRAEVARFFGYIRDRVLRMGFEAVDDEGRRRAIETIYEHDDIEGTIARLSSDEHHIHANGELVGTYLGKAKGPERASKLGSLSPWVRLCWLASYPALRAEELVKHADAVGLVRDALAALPERRQGAAGSIVLMIANNLCHVSPAYTRPDRTHAALASSLLELVLDRPELPAEAALHAATFAEWSGNDERALALGEQALARFPHHREILSGAIAAAGRLGRTDQVETWSQRLSALPPDETTVLNQSFALVKAGKLAEGFAVVERYLRLGGAPTGNVLVNATYLLRHGKPEAAIAAETLDRVLAALAADRALLQRADLVENVVSAMNTNGRAAESIAIVDEALGGGLRWTPALACNTTYSAVVARDAALARRVAEQVESALEEQGDLVDHEPGILDNLGCLWGLAGELDKGFATLQRYVARRPPDRTEWESSSDYAAFVGDPRWEALFAPAGGGKQKKPKKPKKS